MIRLERRILRDPNEIDGPARAQDCAGDDARRLLIQWTEAGTWYPAGEQGFRYASFLVSFGFLANVGGDDAPEGPPAALRRMIGLDPAAPPDHVTADLDWFRNRIWKGAIA